MFVNNFLLPLILTILVEGLVGFLMGYKNKQLMQVIAAANAITNPFMNFIAVFILYLGLQEFFYWLILPLELLLIPIEWIILSYAIPDKRSEMLKLSAIMNISSFVIGLVIF